MMFGDDAKTWLRRSGYWIPSTPSKDKRKQEVSHVFLDGGKAFVPPDKRGFVEGPDAGSYGFLDAYTMDLVAGRPLHVVERTFGPKGSYRMFADFDIALPEVSGDPEAFLMSTVERALSALPRDSPMRSPFVVCTRRWRDDKIGAHIIWSDEVRVNDAIATRLRDRWVGGVPPMPPPLESREKELPPLEGAREGARDQALPPLDEIIDASVYRRNGLRMPWSLKRGGHPSAAYAPTHHGRFDEDGRLEIKRIGPISTFDPSAIKPWLERASICAREDGGVTVVVDEELSRSSSCTSKASEAFASKKRPRDAIEDDDDASSFSLDDASITVLCGILSPLGYLDDGGRDALGARCKRSISGSSLLISSGSRRCRLAKREHTSNHVYFVATSDGKLAQRCHSTCTDCAGRSETISEKHGLDPALFASSSKKRATRKPPASCVRPSATAASDAAARWLKRAGFER